MYLFASLYNGCSHCMPRYLFDFLLLAITWQMTSLHSPPRYQLKFYSFWLIEFCFREPVKGFLENSVRFWKPNVLQIFVTFGNIPSFGINHVFSLCNLESRFSCQITLVPLVFHQIWRSFANLRLYLLPNFSELKFQIIIYNLQSYINDFIHRHSKTNR